MTAIKERPILFSGPMVRAILDGRKTVTRRVLAAPGQGWEFGVNEPGITFGTINSPHPKRGKFGVFVRRELSKGGGKYERDLVICPYGQPGDRLWVRESLRLDPEYGHYYAAGGRHGETVYLCSLFDDEDKQTGPSYDGLLPERSVPSIHLHRRYSRILLEITDVRVERLNDISEDQALAEGVTFSPVKPQRQSTMGRDAFADLWANINGVESWEANPWVWVVEFKRIEQ